jgi:hypothetical protein
LVSRVAIAAENPGLVESLADGGIAKVSFSAEAPLVPGMSYRIVRVGDAGEVLIATATVMPGEPEKRAEPIEVIVAMKLTPATAKVAAGDVVLAVEP